MFSGRKFYILSSRMSFPRLPESKTLKKNQRSKAYIWIAKGKNKRSAASNPLGKEKEWHAALVNQLALVQEPRLQVSALVWSAGTQAVHSSGKD